MVQTMSMEQVKKGLDRGQILSHVLPRMAAIGSMDDMEERGIVYRVYLNMAIRYYIPLDTEDQQQAASIQITEKLLDSVGLTAQEIHDAAIENLRGTFSIDTMAAMLSRLMGDDFDLMGDMVDSLPMWIITNQNQRFGAASILSADAIAAMQERLGDRFYILPSSIHEVIAIPCGDDISSDVLISMVREINSTMVDEWERLSDSVYLCDHGQITMA